MISIILVVVFLMDIPLKLAGTLTFFLPVYLVITIENARADEWKALGHIFSRERFQELVSQLAKKSPTIHTGCGRVLDYASCEDATDWDDINRVISKKGRAAVLFKMRLKITYADDLKDVVGRSKCSPSGSCCCCCCSGSLVPDLDGLLNEAIVICNGSRKPFWMNRLVYFLFNLLLLGWPYRGVFNMVVKTKELKIAKKFYKTESPSLQTVRDRLIDTAL